jgi:hypothetical protein
MYMKTISILKHPTAFLPLAMSLGALATVLTYLAMHGPAPQPDEGAAAHIWQLLMAGQVPIIALFAITWIRKTPKQSALILALQFIAAVAAMAPVYMLHW